MQILICGLGSIGRRHLENARRLVPSAHITVFRHAASATDHPMSEGFDLVVHDLDDALRERPDIAVVASPAPFHVSTATRLAAAGVHVLIEKPLADTLDGIDALASVAAQTGSVVMVGYHLRFSPSLQVLHAAHTRGLIGRTLAIRAEVGQYLPDWRPGADYRDGVSAKRELGGGVVLELSHELDYVRWLGGEVASVQAEIARLGDLAIDVEDTAEIILRLSGGCIASIHLDMVQRSPTRTCKIIGSEGTLLWDGLAGSVRHFAAHDGVWTDLLSPATAPDRNDMYLAEMQHFMRCAFDGLPASVDVATGRRIVQIALAAKRSADLGEAVRLDRRSGE